MMLPELGQRAERLQRAVLARWCAARWQPFRCRVLPPLALLGAGPSLDQLLRRPDLDPGTADDCRPVLAWSLARIVRRHLGGGQIALARLPRPLVPALSDVGLLLPELVDAVVEMAEDGWLRSRLARSNLRRIVENGLTWTFSTEPQAFDRFYAED